VAKQDSTGPGELRSVAVLARGVADDFAHAVAVAATAGIVIDDEIYQCSAAVESWASWLAARAAQADGPG
jgi:hypothetical protein